MPVLCAAACGCSAEMEEMNRFFLERMRVVGIPPAGASTCAFGWQRGIIIQNALAVRCG
jgi:hypothetical protein